MKVNGGEAVYQVLVANGIETVFGLLGGSMLELYDAIHRNQGLRYVGARDERAAAHKNPNLRELAAGAFGRLDSLLLAGHYSASSDVSRAGKMKHFSFCPACSANVTLAAVSTAMIKLAASQQPATLTNAGE